MTKTLEVKIVEGTSKSGNKYTACDILDGDGTRIDRIFMKPTEYEFFAALVGKYQAVESGK